MRHLKAMSTSRSSFHFFLEKESSIQWQLSLQNKQGNHVTPKGEIRDLETGTSLKTSRSLHTFSKNLTLLSPGLQALTVCGHLSPKARAGCRDSSASSGQGRDGEARLAGQVNKGRKADT